MKECASTLAEGDLNTELSEPNAIVPVEGLTGCEGLCLT